MRLRRRRRRCDLFRSWIQPHGDASIGSLQEPIASAIDLPECSTPNNARAVLSPASSQPSIHPAVASQAPPPPPDKEENQELYRCVLRELEFHEESEITRSASMSSVRTLSSTLTDISPSHRAPPPQYQGPAPLPRHILLDVLRRLRLRELPEFELARQLVEETRDLLRDFSSTLVRLSAPDSQLIVVGDIHGHLNDLLHIQHAFGEPNEFNQFLFNGDLVDRGNWGPEVLLTIFCLKLLHPDAVHLNRGNHEDGVCNEYYGFHRQVIRAYPRHGLFLYDLIQEAFNELPLCHVIGGKIFVVHGGLPLMDITLSDIENVQRGPVPLPANTPAEQIFISCLWSDPSEMGSGRSSRGAGWRFGPLISQRFLERNNLRCIIRSHECIKEGIQAMHAGLVWTVFSASNYNRALEGNNACVAIIDANLNVRRGDAWNETHVKASAWWNHYSSEVELTIARLCRQVCSAETHSTLRERALSELHRMIFLARAQLLDAFEEADVKRDGRITPESWADVMSMCLRTPPDFPWAEIGPALFSVTPCGDIAYVDFIFRYDNPFSRWLANQWCAAALHEISTQLGDSACLAFDCLDKNKGCRGSRAGLLSYNELRPLIYQHLPVTGHQAQQQSVHVLELFRSMDSGRTGFITREEFLAALEQANKKYEKCPKGHELLEHQVRCWFPCRQQYACDKCGRDIPLRESRRYCRRCDYDLCYLCSGHTARVQMEWDGIELAISILCRSHCDVRALFHAVDLNGDGFVDRLEFVECVGGLLGGRTDAAASIWDLVWQQDGMNMVGSDGFQGKMQIEDFVRCLAVIDTEA